MVIVRRRDASSDLRESAERSALVELIWFLYPAKVERMQLDPTYPGPPASVVRQTLE